MTPAIEKRLLQFAVALVVLVPLSVSSMSIVQGPGAFGGASNVPIDLDSHFRYLSGLFLMMGLWFAACIPGIERKGAQFRMLGAMVVAGGLARLLSLVLIGTPSRGHVVGLALELGVVPLLMLWQTRVARRARD